MSPVPIGYTLVGFAFGLAVMIIVSVYKYVTKKRLI